MTQEQPDKHAASADALRAMADGEHVEPASEADKASPPDGQAARGGRGGDEPSSRDKPDPAFAVEYGGRVDRKARAAYAARLTRRTHAAQFKRTMIPLLIAAAGLLILMATVVGIKLLGSQAGANRPTNSLLGKPWTPYLVLGAFPLAAALLAGAWLFHRELKRRGP